MAISLIDDGTLDTVLRCDKCGEEFRFNYECIEADPNGTQEAWEEEYRAWVARIQEETANEHEEECDPDAAYEARCELNEHRARGILPYQEYGENL